MLGKKRLLISIKANDAVESEHANEDNENVYLMKVRYLSNGDGDQELQAAREKFMVYKRRLKKGYKKSNTFFCECKRCY